MKVLITGATGFIGQHLILALQKKKVDIVALVRSKSMIQTALPKNKIYRYTDTLSLIAFMEKEKFDGVIHLASLFLVNHTEDQVEDLVMSNVVFGTSVLEAATKTKTTWFINTGTFIQHYKSKTYSPVNLYAATKQAFQDIITYYVDTATTKIITLKLFDTFGPGDTRPKIFALWSKIANTQESLSMSPGKQIIDMNYITNVVDAYMHAMALLAKKDTRVTSGGSYLVSQGERMTLRELASLFEVTTKKKLTIIWGGRPYRNREIMNPWSKDPILPGWKPKVSLAQGIKKLFNTTVQ